MSALQTRCASISEPPITGGYVWQIRRKEYEGVTEGVFIDRYSAAHLASRVTSSSISEPLPILSRLPSFLSVRLKEGHVVRCVFLVSPSNNPQSPGFEALKGRSDAIDELLSWEISHIQDVHCPQHIHAWCSLENRTRANCKAWIVSYLGESASGWTQEILSIRYSTASRQNPTSFPEVISVETSALRGPQPDD